MAGPCRCRLRVLFLGHASLLLTGVVAVSPDYAGQRPAAENLQVHIGHRGRIMRSESEQEQNLNTLESDESTELSASFTYNSTVTSTGNDPNHTTMLTGSNATTTNATVTPDVADTTPEVTDTTSGANGNTTTGGNGDTGANGDTVTSSSTSSNSVDGNPTENNRKWVKGDPTVWTTPPAYNGGSVRGSSSTTSDKETSSHSDVEHAASSTNMSSHHTSNSTNSTLKTDIVALKDKKDKEKWDKDKKDEQDKKDWDNDKKDVQAEKDENEIETLQVKHKPDRTKDPNYVQAEKDKEIVTLEAFQSHLGMNP